MLTALTTSLRSAVYRVILPRAGTPARFEITIGTERNDGRVQESVAEIERLLQSNCREFRWLTGKYDVREFNRYQVRAIRMPSDEYTISVVNAAPFVSCVEKKAA